jgi:dipeptidyl aminopeptidase/acylaminoacyl peptidase
MHPRLWALLALAALPAAAAELVPVADFFRREAVTEAVMSPSGGHVAAAYKGGPKGRLGLVVLDVADVTRAKALVSFADADVRSIGWVNDDRLVFTVTDHQAAGADQIGTGLFAIDREGKEPAKTLIQRRFYGQRLPGERFTEGKGLGLSTLHGLRALVRDGSNDVIVERYDYNDRRELIGTTLLRLDTVTGIATNITLGGPPRASAWAVNRKGDPLVAYSYQEGISRLYWKPEGDAPWQQVWEGKTWGGGERHFYPFGVDGKGLLYGTAPLGANGDTYALTRIDLTAASPRLTPILTLDGYDFSGTVIYGRDGSVIAARFLTDARGTYWMLDSMRALQKKVDALLPQSVNEIYCGNCADPKVLLVKSWSDREPDTYRLYDVAKESLALIAQSRPWIKPAQMARREMKRFAARDGLQVPVHITHPNGKGGPAPTVVLVHGGPFVRGAEWGWEPESQFLASRGYLVLEPEFRGSTGFGFKHFQAGWRQWGLAMQDDVADATRWAIDLGLADPKRICIAGASYGGYATLMGLARYPELYLCGVNWVGVTDMDLLYDPANRWSDTGSAWRDYGLPVLVGDPQKDAKQLAETSPVRIASRIKRPVLMAYGLEDRRVPIFHGTRMREALREHQVEVEWHEYRDEGHGFFLEANELDFWTKVERFLAKHLQGGGR